MSDFTVIFQPSGRRGQVASGLTIVQASRNLGEDIEAICGEQRVCGKCKVKIEEGFFEKLGIRSAMSHLSPWTTEEGKFISHEERAQEFQETC
jgi:uncharacterized 2Fe-2S/4Fe-4S cluster protein (DUF4445 family)